MGKILKWVLGLAVPGAGGLAALLLGGGADGLMDAAKDVGVVLIVKSALEDLLAGPDLAFARAQILIGAVLLGAVIALHFWRGESWAGKFRAAWWLWCTVGGVAALLVVSGIVDGAVTRMRTAAAVTAQLPLPEPQRQELRRKVARSLYTSPSGRTNCQGCE